MRQARTGASKESIPEENDQTLIEEKNGRDTKNGDPKKKRGPKKNDVLKEKG